jgi:hypothetical protein
MADGALNSIRRLSDGSEAASIFGKSERRRKDHPFRLRSDGASFEVKINNYPAGSLGSKFEISFIQADPKKTRRTRKDSKMNIFGLRSHHLFCSLPRSRKEAEP